MTSHFVHASRCFVNNLPSVRRVGATNAQRYHDRRSVQLREHWNTTPTQYSCAKVIKQISTAVGLHTTPRCRYHNFNRDVKVSLRNRRLHMQRYCKKRLHFQSRQNENWLRAGWHENFMHARCTPSVVASESVISALIKRNSACNYCARFERTRPSENF